ncbi:MAG: cysteine desulfurase, partial [Elusimicrobia bacterium]|nr:cysteine desulfurase [Elusimicrobiota bacterium]
MALDIGKIRRDFPILGRSVHGKPLVYFDNAATTQKPASVIAALKDFYERTNANIHRGIHTLSEEATARVEQTREKAARFIHAPKAHTVVFTRNATEAINLVAYGWGRKFLRAGDEILLTEMEHHSNLVPWQMLAQEKGARLRFVPMMPEGTLNLETVRRTLTPKTKLFSFIAVSNALGTVNPVKELVRTAHDQGALALVDASQWVPHYRTDVLDWNCDFLAFSGHKMLGPTGIGVLYGREELLEAMDPFLGGGDMIREVWLERSTYGELPNKFEAGTPAIAEIVALSPAIDYLETLGFEALAQHERELTGRALEIFRAEGIRTYGLSGVEQRAGVVSFNVGDIHPHDVGQVFDLEGIAIRAGHHCCQPLMRKLQVPGTARASFYLYNTLEEVESLKRTLRRVKDFFK